MYHFTNNAYVATHSCIFKTTALCELKCKEHNIHKMADVQNTFYYNEHAPSVDR